MTVADALAVGDEVELDIGAVGHGGICVARLEGRVIFVRYALPGERALVRITEVRVGSFCRGEVVAVVQPHPERVSPACAHFGPGGCGGCDFQHAGDELQRRLKADVVAEQLRRLAGLEWQVKVEAMPTRPLGWRTRVRWAVDGAVAGPRRFRSHDVVPVDAAAPCVIAADDIAAGPGGAAPKGADEVVLVRRPDAGAFVAWQRRGRTLGAPDGELVETVLGRSFAVRATGFWQAHQDAPEVFSLAVRDALAGFDLVGASAWDLYGGVGLFAAVLADLVGPVGSVVTVESDAAASRLAGRNLRDLPTVRTVTGRVERALADLPGSVDAIVLDPPRSGAGREVIRALAARTPRVVVYVACDPAALARDTATLRDNGYELAALRAFDAFPQTHHVECVATFVAGT